MNFKQYVKLIEQNTVGKHNDFATSAFLPSDWTGSEMSDINIPFLSSLDIQVPTTIRRSIISNIIKNKNPIVIELEDGTKLNLSLDEFNRINKNPCIGQTAQVTFQRNVTDNSNSASKIIKIEIS
jgi:hypothetical protein